MKHVTPELRIIARPSIDYVEMEEYLETVNGTAWSDRVFTDKTMADAELLAEFAGRLCYRSWEPGLNANVTKVREDSAAYLSNVLASGHGSVFEHAQFSFVAYNVSRVFTHELVRHRMGAAYSQESLRFVRLTDLSMWFPSWFRRGDKKLAKKAKKLVRKMEEFQIELAERFGLDDPDVNFNEKKAKTSFMRRFAPIGLSTTIMFSMNVRTIRHFIEQRSNPHAEEEIRLIAHKLGEIMKNEAPLLFADYEQVYTENGSTDTNENAPHWVPETRKV